MNKKTTFSLKAPPTVAGFAAYHPIMSSSEVPTETQKSLLKETITDFQKLPNVWDSVEELDRIITAEERKSHLVAYRDISPQEDGSISVGGDNFKLGHVGFKGIVRSIAPSGALTYLSSVDADLRNYNISKLLEKTPHKRISMRTRKTARGEGREIFSVVSEDYPHLYSNHVLVKLLPKMLASSKGLFRYDPNTTTVTLKELQQRDVDVKNWKYDRTEAFRVGREFFLRDDGSTSLGLSLLMFRHLCSNMLLMGDGVLKMPRVRHRGKPDDVIARISKVVDNSHTYLSDFHSLWAKSTNHVFNYGKLNKELVAAVYGSLLNGKHLSALGRNKDTLALAFAEKWADEGGNTVAALVNGITAYSRNHSVTNSSVFSDRVWEKEAGKLLSLPNSAWDKTRKIKV